MKKTILLPTLFLLLIANCQLIVAQSNFKNVERSSITNTDDASKKLNAQTIDNSLYQQNKAPVKAYIFDDTDALNEFTALRQGIKIVKDGESGLPIFIEGRIKNIQKSARSGRTSAEAMAFNYLASVKGILKLENPDESFEVKSVETDALGQNHIRLQQTYQGLSIYGGDLILHTEGNDVTTMNGRYFPTPYIQDITANVSQLEAENLALKDLATSTIVQPLTAGEKKILDYEKPQTELLIYHVKGNTEGERLAYRIEIHPNFLEHWVCFVDAKTGTVLRKYNNMCSVDGPNKATALDLNGVSRSLDTYLFKNTYFLLDAIRVGPDGKAMFKLPSSTMPDNPVGALLTLDAQNSSVSSQNLNLAHITSSNNAWSNKTAVSAHYNAAMAFEYYKTVHKRNSIDGKGGTIISIINITDDKGAQLDNAFWSDKIMVYGNGKTSFKPLAGGLDVAAHEMTHGVVQNSANLEYDSQSGAMNESMADIFGAMVDRKNWTMGEDVVKTNIFPSGALRDLSNPNQGGKNTRGYQPKNMNEYYTGEDDNSGVHINSGIPNWAFFKFATATSKEKAEQTYYRALTQYLTRTSRFLDLRLAVIKAAGDLYGANGAEVTAAKAAFDAVGITDQGGTTTTTPPVVLPSNPGSDFLLLYAIGDKKLYNTPIDLSAFNPLIPVTIKHKPSVSDDGLFAYYVTSDDKNIKAISLKGALNETVISNQAFWENVAISKDGNNLAAITNNQDKTIWVYSYPKKAWKSFTLYNPTSAQDVQVAQVRYSDSFEWDPTGEYLVYDAYNELTTSGFSAGTTNGAIGYWDIGIIKVWDNAKNDFGTGAINKIISNLEKGESIGNPTFSKNSPNIVAFDYLDPDGKYYIIGTDIDKGTIGGILQNNTVGYPEYSKLDTKMVFNTKTGTREDIGIIDLNTDKISPKTTMKAFVTNAKWASWYGQGVRTLPKKNTQTISASATIDKTVKDPAFSINATATSNLPVGYSWVSGPADIAGNVVTLTGTQGQVKLTAYQSGNSAFYAATPLTITINVGAAAVILANEPTLDDQIVTFPNPMGDVLTIKVPSNLKIENISITTANGSTLMSQKPKSNDISLDVSPLTTGTYLLNVKTAEGNVVKKVVKE